jgi:hypothetical protein
VCYDKEATMTTLPRSSGFLCVTETNQIRIQGNGSVFCAMGVEDYAPPSAAQLVSWVDFGDANAPTTRGGDIPIPGRALDASQTGVAVTTSNLSIGSDSVFAVSRQNDRPVAHFGSTSTGLVGTWGPLASDGSWTMMMYMKTDRPVNDFGAVYTGLGRPMVLFSCPAVGLSIELPTQGIVPEAAIYNGNNDAPIDGVTAGTPWDVVFVDHWRQLCITNDTSSGTRKVYVDGWLVSTTAASNFRVLPDTPVVIGAGCPMTFAEWLVWDGVPVTAQDIRQTCQALRTKWGVPMQLVPPSVSASTAKSVLLALPATLRQTAEPPSPVLWLDATRGVCRDTLGSEMAPAFGRVLRWNDSGSGGNHCSFSPNCRAAYGVGPLDRINSRLPVVQIQSGPGLFRCDPLTGTETTGFTILALWRTVAEVDGGGGHPLAGSSPDSAFGEAVWKEWIGSDGRS